MSCVSDKINEKRVVFFDDSHSYWLGTKRLESVGSVLETYFPEFDRQYWSVHKALEAIYGEEYKNVYSSMEGMRPDPDELFIPFLQRTPAGDYQQALTTVLQGWRRNNLEATWRGTRFHKEFESLAYEQGELQNPWDRQFYDVQYYVRDYDNSSVSLDLQDLKDGVYLELLVFDPEFRVAGQADIVYIQTIDGKRYVDIDDLKTNKKKPSRSSMDMCLPPLDGFQASTHFRYSLQMNFYAFLLSLYGFVPRNMGYTHFKKYDLETGKLNDVENHIDLIRNLYVGHFGLVATSKQLKTIK